MAKPGGARLRRLWTFIIAGITTLAALIGVISQVETIARFSCQYFAQAPGCTTLRAEENARRLVTMLFGDASEADVAAARTLIGLNDPDIHRAMEDLLSERDREDEAIYAAINRLGSAVWSHQNPDANRAFGELAYPLAANRGPLAQIELAMAPAAKARMTMIDAGFGAPLPSARIPFRAGFRLDVRTPVAGEALLLERRNDGKVIVLSPATDSSPPGGDKLRNDGTNRFPVRDDLEFEGTGEKSERGRYVLIVAPERFNVEGMRHEIAGDSADGRTASFTGLRELAGFLQREVANAPDQWAVATLDYEFFTRD